MTAELITNTATPGQESPLCSLLAPIQTTPAPGTVETYPVSAPAPPGLRSADGQFRVVIDDEYMVVTAKADGSSPWQFQRGAEGSAPNTHPAGSSVFFTLSAGGLTALVGQGGGSSAPVQSVNGKSDNVVLTAGDVGAYPTAAADGRFIHQDGTGLPPWVATGLPTPSAGPVTITKSGAFPLNPTTGPFNQPLPDATLFTGVLLLSAVGVSTNAVTLTTVGGQTIENYASGQLAIGHSVSGAAYNAVMLASDRANWRIHGTKENRVGEPLSLVRDFALNTSMSASVLKTKINSAIVSAISCGRPFLSLDHRTWPVDGPVVIPSAPFHLCGPEVIENWGPGPGNPQWAYPQGTPPFIGGGLLQMSSGVDILQAPVAGPAVHLQGFGLIFNTPFLNTGNCYTAKPPNDVGGRPDYGITGGKMVDIKCYGVDPWHYAIEVTNQILATYSRLRSYGGGGFHYITNSDQSQMGNILWLDNEVCIFIGGSLSTPGTSHGYFFDHQDNEPPSGWMTLARCQAIFEHVTVQPAGTIAPAVAPNGSQKTRAFNGSWEAMIWTDADMEGGSKFPTGDDAPGPGSYIPSMTALPIATTNAVAYNNPTGQMMMLAQSFIMNPLPATGEYLVIGTNVNGMQLLSATLATGAQNIVPYFPVGRVYAIASDGALLYVTGNGIDQINVYNQDGSTAPIPSIGTLSSSLTTGAAITSIPVAAGITKALPANATITLDDGAGHSQAFVTSGPVAANAASIPVASQAPSAAFPATTTKITPLTNLWGTGVSPWGIAYTAPSIGALTFTLSTAAAITTLAVAGGVGVSLAKGATVILNDGAGHTQAFVTSAAVAPGAISIPVVSQVPTFAFPANTTQVTQGRLYWTCNTDNTIQAANADGTGTVTTIVTGCNSPRHICTDGTILYWCNSGDGTIGKATLAGASANQAWGSGFTMPTGIALSGTTLYITSYTGGTITTLSTNTGGAAGAALITGLNQPHGVAVDSTYVYWASFANNQVGRATLAGGSITPTWATNIAGPIGLCVVNPTVISSVEFWTRPALSTGFGSFIPYDKRTLPAGAPPGQEVTLHCMVPPGGLFQLVTVNAAPGSIQRSYPMGPVKDSW